MAKSSFLLERSDIAQVRKKLSDQAELRIAAANAFVQGQKGRQIVQLTTRQAWHLYERIAEVDFAQVPAFATAASQVQFFARLREAVHESRVRFPGSPSYAFVDGDAAAKIADRLVSDKRLADAEAMLRVAIAAFKEGRILERTTGFSETTWAVCAAWSAEVRVLADLHRVGDAVRSHGRLIRRCRPALAKYPWDFYLRDRLKGAAARVGKLLFEEKRYADALPLLKETSDWGVKESSQLLAKMYENGWSVPKDTERAANTVALAERQSIKWFTVPVLFDGVKAPFDFCVQELAPGVGFQGIDDQVTWLKEARGGTVPDEVIASFRKLNELARKHNVSFPELTFHAMKKANEGGDSKSPAKAEKEQPKSEEPPAPE
jgi:tetratricopeptide (TPR) repeat protein